MTYTVNPKSTRRNAVIVANAYALPSLMTPQLEARLGADMAETARREGHIARMPPDMTRKPDGATGGRASAMARKRAASHTDTGRGA